MLPDRVSLTYESGALPIALRGPALEKYFLKQIKKKKGGDAGISLLLHFSVHIH